jgi:hypothetical protein
MQEPNGVRYPLVGGTGQHHFAGTNFKPQKLPENAPTPTSRVHAVLGALTHFEAQLTLFGKEFLYPMPKTNFEYIVDLG